MTDTKKDLVLPERSGSMTMDRGIQLKNFEDVARAAAMIQSARWAPESLDTQEKIAAAIMQGSEVGLGPMASLKSIAVINGRPSIWGDGAMALVLSSGLLEFMDERIEGEGDDRVAICEIQRRGLNRRVYTFSVADAKKAGLWEKKTKSGKDTPWINYPERMLKMRARGFALRDNFADVLSGLFIGEEAMDMPPMREINPIENPLGEPPAKGGEVIEPDEDVLTP